MDLKEKKITLNGFAGKMRQKLMFLIAIFINNNNHVRDKIL